MTHLITAAEQEHFHNRPLLSSQVQSFGAMFRRTRRETTCASPARTLFRKWVLFARNWHINIERFATGSAGPVGSDELYMGATNAVITIASVGRWAHQSIVDGRQKD